MSNLRHLLKNGLSIMHFVDDQSKVLVTSILLEEININFSVYLLARNYSHRHECWKKLILSNNRLFIPFMFRQKLSLHLGYLKFLFRSLLYAFKTGFSGLLLYYTFISIQCLCHILHVNIFVLNYLTITFLSMYHFVYLSLTTIIHYACLSILLYQNLLRTEVLVSK